MADEPADASSPSTYYGDLVRFKKSQEPVRVVALLGDVTEQFIVAPDLAAVEGAAAPQRNELLQKNSAVVLAILKAFTELNKVLSVDQLHFCIMQKYGIKESESPLVQLAHSQASALKSMAQHVIREAKKTGGARLKWLKELKDAVGPKLREKKFERKKSGESPEKSAAQGVLPPAAGEEASPEKVAITGPSLMMWPTDENADLKEYHGHSVVGPDGLLTAIQHRRQWRRQRLRDRPKMTCRSRSKAARKRKERKETKETKATKERKDKEQKKVTKGKEQKKVRKTQETKKKTKKRGNPNSGPLWNAMQQFIKTDFCTRH
ncbi:unnamed protein product [Symbiodinium sp. CCMP2592]|nr:unnamed protein product [Symbiodinium sp. CCMP2592]